MSSQQAALWGPWLTEHTSPCALALLIPGPGPRHAQPPAPRQTGGPTNRVCDPVGTRGDTVPLPPMTGMAPHMSLLASRSSLLQRSFLQEPK